MPTRISDTELEARLNDILSRVRSHGERFLVEHDGELIAELRPATHLRAATFDELLDRLDTIPRPDDRFADDLEAIQAAQPPITLPPTWDD